MNIYFLISNISVDNITLITSDVMPESYGSRPNMGHLHAACLIVTGAPLPGDRLTCSAHRVPRARIAEALSVFHTFITCSLIKVGNKFTLSLYLIIMYN